MIRVLHVIGAMDRAGAETMIMNYYCAIDRNEIQFDFLVHTDRHCDYDDEIEALGGNIYHIPRFNGLNYFGYKKACREFFKHHPEIDIVHGHIESSASIYLPEAHKAGKATICHSHQANGPITLTELAFRAVTLRNKHAADRYMACSIKSGIDRFGHAVVESDRFSVLKNAIAIEKYASSKEERKRTKEKFGLNGKPVFGHVGRFTEAKNHPFLIQVFERIKQSEPNAQLLLIGRGENEEKIRELVESKQLNDSVHFLGIRNDVEAIMKAMDVFLFPSLYEGLGIVVIEAQASGLPCIVSEAIPDEAVILPTMVRLPLASSRRWATAAIDSLSFDRGVLSSQRTIVEHGYDIRISAKKLTDTYQQMANQ